MITAITAELEDEVCFNSSQGGLVVKRAEIRSSYFNESDYFLVEFLAIY